MKQLFYGKACPVLLVLTILTIACSKRDHSDQTLESSKVHYYKKNGTDQESYLQMKIEYSDSSAQYVYGYPDANGAPDFSKITRIVITGQNDDEALIYTYDEGKLKYAYTQSQTSQEKSAALIKISKDGLGLDIDIFENDWAKEEVPPLLHHSFLLRKIEGVFQTDITYSLKTTGEEDVTQDWFDEAGDAIFKKVINHQLVKPIAKLIVKWTVKKDSKNKATDDYNKDQEDGKLDDIVLEPEEIPIQEPIYEPGNFTKLLVTNLNTNTELILTDIVIQFTGINNCSINDSTTGSTWSAIPILSPNSFNPNIGLIYVYSPYNNTTTYVSTDFKNPSMHSTWCALFAGAQTLTAQFWVETPLQKSNRIMVTFVNPGGANKSANNTQSNLQPYLFR